MGEDLDRRFDYHPPDAAAKQAHQLAREGTKILAGFAAELGQSRDVSLALTKLEEAMFWMNAHIARNGV